MESMFGAVDRKEEKVDGKIGSYSPAWTQKKNITELNEEIGVLERDLDAGVIPSDEMGAVGNAIKNLKSRMNNIVDSKPKYSASEETSLLGELKSLNEQVGRTLYSEYEQEKPGKYSDPHLEADINDLPHKAKIEVNREVALACNINPEKMKNIGSATNVHISRNSADKIRRFLCDYWDIPEYNREHLRSRSYGGRKPTVSMSDIPSDRYNMAFNNEGNGNDEITKLREEVTRLKAQVKEKIQVRKKPQKQKRKAAEVKPWECVEEGCGFKGTTRSKSLHMIWHVKQAQKNTRHKEELGEC